MRITLLVLLCLVSVIAFGQKTDVELNTQNNNTIFTATLTPTRVGNMFEQSILSKVNKRTPEFMDSLDITKIIRFYLNGSHPTATQYNVTWPNKSGTVAFLDDVSAAVDTISLSGNYILSDGNTTMLNDVSIVRGGYRFNIGDDLPGSGVRFFRINDDGMIFSDTLINFTSSNFGPFWNISEGLNQFDFGSNTEGFKMYINIPACSSSVARVHAYYDGSGNNTSCAKLKFVSEVTGSWNGMFGDNQTMRFGRMSDVGVLSRGFSTDATGISMVLGSDATGDIPYRNSSGYLTRLPIGTNGQILTVNGSGLPSWNTPLSGWLTGTLTNDVNIDGGHNIGFGQSTPLSSFAINTTGDVNFTTSTFNNYFNLANLGAEVAFGSDWGIAFRYDHAGLGTFNLLHGVTDGVSAEGFQIDDNGSIKFRIPLSGSNWQVNLGSDQTGDTYYRNSSGYFTRLAKGAEGTLLRAGASVPAYSTFTIPNTISALSTFVANSANVLTTVTPAAGQSIRVNAGGTAWEAYTPTSGIGGSVGATDNALLRADVGSGVVQSSPVTIDDSGNMGTGLSTTSGSSRTETATGSASDIAISKVAKGNGGASLLAPGTGTASVSSVSGDAQLVAGDTAKVEGLGGVLIESGGVVVLSAEDAINDPTVIQIGKQVSGAGEEKFITVGNYAQPLNILADTATTIVYGNGNWNFNNDLQKTDSVFQIDFQSGKSIAIDGTLPNIVVSGTSATIDVTYIGKNVKCTSASETDLTIPSNLQLESVFTVTQRGNGTINLLAGSNVVINGKTSTTGQWDMIWVYLIEKSGGTSYYIGR